MSEDYTDIARRIGRECAETAWEQRTVDRDGTVLCAADPLPGDYDALSEVLDTAGHSTLPDGGEENCTHALADAYRARMDQLRRGL